MPPSGLSINIREEKAEEIIKAAEKELNEDTISDQNKYLLDQKIETLNSLNLN